ncbi:hypothetical protein Droror1_Dr00005346 [Drosera rotundifolia]
MSHYSHAPSTSHDRSHHGQGLERVPIENHNRSLKILLLHGHLDIWVREAKNLPNLDLFHQTLAGIFSKLPGNMSDRVTSDPYVTVSVSGAIVARTFVIRNSENPIWMQNFHVPVAHYAAEVHFVVKDDDLVGSQIIGFVSIPVEELYSGKRVEGMFPVVNEKRNHWESGAALSLVIQYTPIARMQQYHLGVGSGPEYHGVPRTYFPLRGGCKVTLYQDAHVEDGMLPNLMLDNGGHYLHGKCWHDIFIAISHAHHLIYITGWSVYHLVRLVRDSHSVNNTMLGDLLKYKAQEGVRVLLLVWDDPTSRSILDFTTEGVVHTNDEMTRQFFKDSSVHVILCPRYSEKGHSLIRRQEAEAIYTHHQKTVIVDADAGHHNRKIVAFVGGLDLCKGRYDTPRHPIFRTLETLHKDDYHNPNFTGPTHGCAREAWHDLHCKIDGPAAYDILTNFEERWLRVAQPHGLHKLMSSHDDYLLKIDRIPSFVKFSDSSHNDGEAWHVQVFRSIDSNSVEGFPNDPKDAINRNLLCGKNVFIDMSIQAAYIHAIRSAQHFIYIENQYFLGSSYNWDSHRDLGANNLIPMEIALKIANKIRANERFAVYVVIPMWPEGDPKSIPMQRILFWQYKTMQMMYEIIYQALVEVGLQNKYEPQDYLNFFCLGTREVLDEHSTKPNTSSSADNTPQARSRKSRRFMIYVHSKGMVVDDEYLILGSANINQRSMDGTRDTEIAMGAYQPQYTWARRRSSPYGQIYGYRMSLWAEHLGSIDDCFRHPESLECVRRVRSRGEHNWSQYAASEITEMRSHLLKYPLEVDRTGKVKPLHGCETFPDFDGKIMGSFLVIQENLTI